MLSASIEMVLKIRLGKHMLVHPSNEVPAMPNACEQHPESQGKEPTVDRCARAAASSNQVPGLESEL